MILSENFVSISDVRDKTSSVMKSVNCVWKKIILSQNKPIWMFLSIDEYNNMLKLNFNKEIATDEDISAYKNSSHGQNGIEAFEFLDNIKYWK